MPLVEGTAEKAILLAAGNMAEVGVVADVAVLDVDVEGELKRSSSLIAFFNIACALFM